MKVVLKRFGVTLLKSVCFIGIWLIVFAVFKIPAVLKLFDGINPPALKDTIISSAPLIAVIIATIVFYFVEKNKIEINFFRKPVRGPLAGLGLGVAWLGVAVGAALISGVVKFSSGKAIPDLALWLISIAAIAIAQEFLIHGYVFALVKREYNTGIAVAVSTILYTLLQYENFDKGTVAIICIVSAGLFLSLLFVYMKALLAPIFAALVYNVVGSVILGVIPAGGAPSLTNAKLSGDVLMTGGTVMKLSGSLIMLIVNVLLVAVVVFLMILKNKKKSA